MCWLMHKVKQKGAKNGILATPPFLVSLFILSDLCQLQDHASLNPAVMVCSCLEITKQEHHTYEPQANNPMDQTFMVLFVPTTVQHPGFCGDIALAGRHEDRGGCILRS